MSMQSLQKYLNKKEIVPESSKAYTSEEIRSYFGCGDNKFSKIIGEAIKNGEWKIVYKRSNLKKSLYMPTKP